MRPGFEYGLRLIAVFLDVSFLSVSLTVSAVVNCIASIVFLIVKVVYRENFIASVASPVMVFVAVYADQIAGIGFDPVCKKAFFPMPVSAVAALEELIVFFEAIGADVLTVNLFKFIFGNILFAFLTKNIIVNAVLTDHSAVFQRIAFSFNFFVAIGADDFFFVHVVFLSARVAGSSAYFGW